jgi:ABC-type spermidine/putrescine transport system permease subunit II
MNRPPTAFVIAAGAAVLCFLVLPNLIIVPISFSTAEFYQFPPPGLSLQWYERFFTDARWIASLLLSLRIGLATTALSVCLGICAAFSIVRGSRLGAGVAAVLILGPLVVPHVILAAGLFVFYANAGLLQTEIGLVLAHTVIAMPIVTVSIMVSVRALRRDLEFAAMSLGAGYTTTFFKVMLPQVLPGILTGAVFAFVTSFDEVTLAIFLGGVRTTTLPMRIWEGITVESNPVLPAVSTILLLMTTIPLLAIELWKRWTEPSVTQPGNMAGEAYKPAVGS